MIRFILKTRNSHFLTRVNSITDRNGVNVKKRLKYNVKSLYRRVCEYQAHSLYAYRTYSYSYSTVIFEPFFQNTVTVTQFQLYSDTRLFTVTKIYVRQ